MTQTKALETSLDFGIFDWIEWDSSPAHEIYENRLRMLEFADRNNFYCYHLAEHHMTPLSVSPSPAVFLSAAAQRTSRIRLGPLVFLLPFYNPIRLLHEICMLDNLSNGRLDLGVGRGIVPMEAEKFDVDLGQSWDMFNEEMNILLTGFTDGTINHNGKHYNFEDVELWIKPYQKPYPPLWYASNNLETVPWMAQHNFNTSHVFASNEVTKTHFDLYKQVWSEQRNANGMNSHVEVPKLGAHQARLRRRDRRTGDAGMPGRLPGLVPQHQFPLEQSGQRLPQLHPRLRQPVGPRSLHRRVAGNRPGAGAAGGG